MSIKLLKHQVKPKDMIVEWLRNFNQGEYNYKGITLWGNMGCGKSYIIASALAEAQKNGLLVKNPNSLAPSSIIFLVPKRAIIQHKRVLHNAGVVDFDVTSGSALASSGGGLMLDWKTIYKNGEIVDIMPVWDKDLMPVIIIADECQLYKNPTAKKTRVLQSYVESGGIILTSSGTPCSKAIETKLIATSCGITHPDNWTYWADGLSNMGRNSNSPIAMKRFKEDLLNKNRLIEVSNVRYPFKPVVRNYMLELSPTKKVMYDKAYADYLELCAQEGKKGPSGIMAIWVGMKKFQMMAEKLRADELGNRAINVQKNQNKAIIIAANHIETLSICYSTLIKNGVLASEISHLRGGMSDEKSQMQIDNFQLGITKYFLTTLKSGGSSISLHHEKENKEALPRHVILPPTWSVFDMAQVLWRANRITSASETVEEILWYKNTIEEDIANRLALKFSCLKELLQRKESFIYDIFVKVSGIDVDSSAIEKIVEEEISNENTKDNEEVEETAFDLSMLED